MSNFPLHGPPLDYYLRNQKVSLNFQGMTGHEFYHRFSFLNVRELVHEGRTNDPTYMARVVQCMFEQHWFESVVASVVGCIEHKMGLRNVAYSWHFVMPNGNWLERVKMTGEHVLWEEEDADERVPVTLEFTIPEVVSEDTNRSMRPWVDHLIAEHSIQRQNAALDEQKSAAEKTAAAWQAHLAEHTRK